MYVVMSVKERFKGSSVYYSIHTVCMYIYIMCVAIHLRTQGDQQSSHQSTLGQSHLIHGKHGADK